MEWGGSASQLERPNRVGAPLGGIKANASQRPRFSSQKEAEEYLKDEEESDFKVVARRRAKRPKRSKGNASSSDDEFPPLKPPQSQRPAPSKYQIPSQTPRTTVDTFRDKSGIFLLQQKNCSPPSVPTQGTAPEAPRIRKPPPIVVHGQGHFLKVKRLASANKQQDCTFLETPEGLKVFPSTPTGYWFAHYKARRMQNQFPSTRTNWLKRNS